MFFSLLSKRKICLCEWRQFHVKGMHRAFLIIIIRRAFDKKLFIIREETVS